MPDVRMPDGTIIRNVPEGVTQSQLQARLSKAQGMPSGPSMGPPENVHDDAFYRNQVHQEAQAIEKETPWINRGSTQTMVQKSLPMITGGLASMVVPGSGWAALAGQSAMAGAGTTVGEMFRQRFANEDTSLPKAAKEGALGAAGNFAGGAVLKGLGAVAKKIFSSPLDEAGTAAARFAKEQGAPFPLSSAAPQSAAGKIQQGSRALLPGEIRTQVDANKVTHFLNNRVSSIVDEASPIDEAALKGQQYLRQVFEPGETVYTQTFQNLRSTVGDDTAIPLANTRQAMESVTQSLKERGEMKAVYNRLRNILKADATELSAAQMDELYSGLLKDTARNANARREANAVLQAMSKDIDGVAQEFGMSFTDDIAKAKAVRDQFRELRNIPQLERLAKDFGDKGAPLGSRQWMSELFANPNGKALAELRSRNPELYHDLADSWLANNISKFSKPISGGIGRGLDGQAFRKWFEANESNLKVVFGAPQTKALDNFSIYAQHMTGAVERASSGGIGASSLLPRVGAELFAIAKKPYIMVPGEVASFVLARGLSDPTSALFKAFTEGFSPATRSFAIKSGQLTGQAVASGKNER